MRNNRSVFFVLLSLLFICDSRNVRGQEVASNQWQLVFEDNFDGNVLDRTKWRDAPRTTALWAKWIRNDKKTVKLRKGRLVCSAISVRPSKEDTATWHTGAINSLGKFNFQYGKVEVRMRTNAKQGNFPAAWLRPIDQSKSSLYGEFDLMESFGREGKAHQTIHSHRSATLRKEKPHEYLRKIDVTKWHVYSMEWTDSLVIFKIDGYVTGAYEKSKSSKEISEGQWTFDRPYYLILNQSLGGRDWNQPKRGVRYETEFDWVRVYQKQSPVFSRKKD